MELSIRGGGGEGATAQGVDVRLASKLRSELESESWCTSTAMVLGPATNAPAGMVTVRAEFSPEPDRLEAASVAKPTGPAGMLSRATSTPLTKTTAPSSATSRKLTDDGTAATFTVRRK